MSHQQAALGFQLIIKELSAVLGELAAHPDRKYFY
jgi:hypothetical protein